MGKNGVAEELRQIHDKIMPTPIKKRALTKKQRAYSLQALMVLKKMVWKSEGLHVSGRTQTSKYIQEIR